MSASGYNEDVVGPTKGRLGVDDPVLLKQGAQERVERLRVGERQTVSVEGQLLVTKSAA